MNAVRELARVLDEPELDAVEVMARAAHTVFARSDRWDRTHERVKQHWREEMRAAIDAGRRAGLLRVLP